MSEKLGICDSDKNVPHFIDQYLNSPCRNWRPVPTPTSPSSKARDTQESLSKENGGKVETSGAVAGEWSSLLQNDDTKTVLSATADWKPPVPAVAPEGEAKEAAKAQIRHDLGKVFADENAMAEFFGTANIPADRLPTVRKVWRAALEYARSATPPTSPK